MNIKYITMSLRAHVVSVAISILSSFPSVIANPLRQMKQSLRTSFFSSVIASVAKQSLFLSLQNITLSFRRKPESRIVLSLREAVSLAAISVFFLLPSSAIAEEKIPVFPTTPVEAYTIYTSLAVFWLAIIGLIVVIKMKLNEIERIQELGIDEEDENAPVLE